jgi:hypothetical protein
MKVLFLNLTETLAVLNLPGLVQESHVTPKVFYVRAHHHLPADCR